MVAATCRVPFGIPGAGIFWVFNICMLSKWSLKSFQKTCKLIQQLSSTPLSFVSPPSYAYTQHTHTHTLFSHTHIHTHKHTHCSPAGYTPPPTPRFIETKLTYKTVKYLKCTSWWFDIHTDRESIPLFSSLTHPPHLSRTFKFYSEEISIKQGIFDTSWKALEKQKSKDWKGIRANLHLLGDPNCSLDVSFQLEGGILAESWVFSSLASSGLFFQGRRRRWHPTPVL